MHLTEPNDNWERDTLNRLAFASLNEQRRARRWRIFFLILSFVYLFLISWSLLKPDWELFGEADTSNDKHTALIEVQGVIAADTDASADNVVSALRDAFEDDDTAGVILRINSPGVVLYKRVTLMMK